MSSSTNLKEGKYLCKMLAYWYKNWGEILVWFENARVLWSNSGDKRFQSIISLPLSNGRFKELSTIKAFGPHGNYLELKVKLNLSFFKNWNNSFSCSLHSENPRNVSASVKIHLSSSVFIKNWVCGSAMQSAEIHW